MVINTATTIITFLMVFLIQRAQNKDILSIHAKLNELIAAKEGASNKLVNIEDCSEEELLKLKDSFRSLSSPEDSSTHAKSITEVAQENRR
jgi:low affinity Fe/Cu permease